MSVTKQKISNMLMDPILFNAAISSQGGKVLVRKIIQVSIASILYQRTDIDKTDFVTRERNGIPYRVFKDKLKCPLTIEVRSWLKGILDAFDKNYLKEVYLLFCNVNDETDVKESYKFHFKYFDNNASSPEAAVTKEEIVETTDFLLRSINDLESFSKFKQDEVTPYIALTYYTDVTPMEYEPPYFGGKDERVVAIMTNVMDGEKKYMYLGALKTKSCRIKCRGKGKLLTIPETTNSEYTSNDTTRISSAIELDADNDDSKNDDNGGENFNESTTVLSDGNCVVLSDGTLNLNKIQCPCSIAVDFKNIKLVECRECYNFQHAACLGYLYSSSIPKTNQCDSCNDSSFPSPNNIFKRERNSIYRLAVAYAYMNKIFPDKVLNECSQKNKELVVQKLLQVNCIKPSDAGYSLDLENLEVKVINKLFPLKSKVVLPDSNSLQDDDTDSVSLLSPVKKLKIK